MKPEVALQYLDDWMIRWRRFQTKEDFAIEEKFQFNRQRNYALTGLVGGMATLYTAAPSTIRRYFGPVHMFDIGIDVWMKKHLIRIFNSRQRYCPNGYGRIVAIALPSYIVLATLQHFDEKARWAMYLQQKTIFGEQARIIEKTGQVQEMLPVNMQASVSDKDKVIFGPVSPA
ncbi:GPI transamidase component [Perkinsela sp. CCAP 1560/4]|nr:GPI transamidase component [Perkinsela sp. CCAP 1560/4]|eukprot:KNH01797.1 GPI transamidase component [Perkinsela sp. CCAP 1560/4]